MRIRRISKTGFSYWYRVSAVIMAVSLAAGSMPLHARALENKENQNFESTEQTADKEELKRQEKPWRELSIGSEEELVDFANSCKLADFSENLEVNLTADLDLSRLEEPFAGITSFSGTFRGNHHTISGFYLQEGSETLGLFKYVEYGAVVRDLTVTGAISSSDSHNSIGGIAGINAGTIVNCSFKGVLTGTAATGGIAGINGATGAINRCQSEGMISSIHTVGGIVGENRGIVSNCTNNASINSDESWLELESESSLSLSLESIMYSVEENWQNGTDIGGIAGFSDGVIAGCVNKNTVGYKHFGKNVGGIAGRQSGEIIRCVNHGKVYGKQDVGGIVGQFEPFTTLEELEELDQAVDELHELMTKMIDDMSDMNEDMHTDLDDLSGTSKSASDTADSLLDEIRYVVEKNIDVVNELSDRLDYAISHFSVVMQYVNESMDKMDLVIDDLTRVKNDLDIQKKMENQSYDESKTKRLVLLDGIGGKMTVDNVNPAQGAEVTVTVTTQDGYELDQLTLTPYGAASANVTGEVSDGEYTFTMPEANVTLAATFRYIGEYIPESNEGGRVSIAENDDKVKIRVIPDGNYEISSLTVGDGEDISATLTEDDGVWTTEVDRQESSSPILVKAVFEEKNNSYPVRISESTGGTVISDMAAAAAGDTVTLTVNTIAGYSVQSIQMNGSNVPQTGEKEYQFQMPAAEAKVVVQFQYTPDGDTEVYVISNVGGRVTAIPIYGTNDYRVDIFPESGYDLADSAMTINGNGGSSKTVMKDETTQNNSSYSYTLNTNNYNTPIKVTVNFAEKSGNATVETVAGTGGVIAAENMVAAGETMSIVVTNEPRYRIARLLVNGEDVTGDVKNGICEYDVPDGTDTIKILADFDPVLLVISSSQTGGTAAYTVNGQEVRITLAQNTGYRPAEPLNLVDADQTAIPYQKLYADSYMYKFDVTDSMKALNPAYLTLTYTKQADKETVDDAKESIERQSDELSASAENISNTADKIQDIMRDEYGEVRDPADLSSDEIRELEDYLLDMADDIGDATVAAGQLVSDVVTIERILSPYVDEAADQASADLDRLSEDANAMNDALQNAGKELQSIVDYFDALDRLKAVNFSNQFDKNADRLKVQMDQISVILDRMNAGYYEHSKILEEDMRAVNDKMNQVFNLLLDKVENMEALANGENIFVDHSAEVPLEGEASDISNCDNDGTVFADRNAGGIVGNIGVDGTDSGDDRNVSIGGKYHTRAILQNSTNDGFVSVKNENAGGIVGYMEVGCVKGCIANGKVSSDSGNNIGGIAGESKGTIDGCCSLAVLSGSKYIGGIAGKGDKIANCYSMASIIEADGFVGAIAGTEQTSDDDDDITVARYNVRERIHDNYYVSRKLYGINGVSYAGVAEPISYEQLLASGSVANAFRHLQVVFTDSDDNVVSQTEIKYGENISDLEYPQIVTDKGDYVEWEGFDGEIMEGNVVIQAVETANVTILSSDEKISAKSLALAEGVFTTAASITAEEIESEFPEEIPSGSVCHVYHVKLQKTGVGEEDSTRVRILNVEGGKATAYARVEGVWQQLEAKKTGSYLEISMTGTEGDFCVASYNPESPVWVYVVIAGCAAVIAGMAAVIVKMKKKMKK